MRSASIFCAIFCVWGWSRQKKHEEHLASCEPELRETRELENNAIQNRKFEMREISNIRHENLGLEKVARRLPQAVVLGPSCALKVG